MWPREYKNIVNCFNFLFLILEFEPSWLWLRHRKVDSGPGVLALALGGAVG